MRKFLVSAIAAAVAMTAMPAFAYSQADRELMDQGRQYVFAAVYTDECGYMPMSKFRAGAGHVFEFTMTALNDLYPEFEEEIWALDRKLTNKFDNMSKSQRKAECAKNRSAVMKFYKSALDLDDEDVNEEEDN